MSDLLRNLEPGKHGAQPVADFMQMRRVPLQPEGTPISSIWMGNDLGALPWSGARPRAGDTVAVVGIAPNQTVIAREQPPMRNPIFVDRPCKCKCLTASGTVFMVLNEIGDSRLSHIVAIKAPEATVYSLFGQAETVDIRGIAVDLEAPNTLYVLDDRRSLSNKVTNTSPSQVILADSYYTVVEYTLTGGVYAQSATYAMVNPGLPGSIFFTLDPVEELIKNQLDPPSIYPGNPLSVVEGLLHITMNRAPARYQRLEGGALVTHTLTLDGAPYAKGLRGRIVNVRDKPASRALRYCISWAGDTNFDNTKPGAAFEVLEFNEADEITRRVTDAEILSPFQLTSVCNRLVVLQSVRYGRTQNDPNGTLLPRVTGEEI